MGAAGADAVGNVGGAGTGRVAERGGAAAIVSALFVDFALEIWMSMNMKPTIKTNPMPPPASAIHSHIKFLLEAFGVAA